MGNREDLPQLQRPIERNVEEMERKPPRVEATTREKDEEVEVKPKISRFKASRMQNM